MFTKIIKNKKIIKYLIIIFILAILFVLIISYKNSPKNGTEYKIYEEERKKTEESNTAPTTTEPITEKLTGDYEYAIYKRNLIKEYPWYRSLPIEKEGYTVVFLTKQKSFRIVLLINKSSPEQEKNNLINQALDDIEKLTGVSYKNYPYFVDYIEDIYKEDY